MTHLVDANVLSEAMKTTPELKVLDWLRRNEREIVINPIILGEIRFGIERMPPGKRKKRLQNWFAQVVERVNCVPIDAATGVRWALLLTELYAAGRKMPIQDSLIAATALLHRFTVATRDVRDFENAGARVLNPFA